MQWLARLRRRWRHRGQRLPLGLRGEREAARFLRRWGYILIARSHRDRIGEIDLVAVDGRTVVFVEVKYRSDLEFGGPELALGKRQQRRIVNAAVRFIQERGLEHEDEDYRFDVLCLTPDGIEHIPDAFLAEGYAG